MVTGAGIRPPRFALRLLLPLIATQCVAAAASEPASYAEPYPAPDSENEKAGPAGTGSFHFW